MREELLGFVEDIAVRKVLAQIGIEELCFLNLSIHTSFFVPVMTLNELLQATRPDDWRSQVAFSPDIEACHRTLFDPSTTIAEAELVLNGWLRSRNHPCVFGRIAAIRMRHTFCILTDRDLQRGDEHVANAILRCRTRWKETARDGNSSSLIITVHSKTLAIARPDSTLKQFVLRLCELILGRSSLDEILHDDLDLLTESGCLRWKAGMSLFASAGDKRWWHDHRFPGGVAFSLNSIGHVATVRALEFQRGNFEERRLWNLRWALRLAMHTIKDASRRTFHCTWLRLRSTESEKNSVAMGGVLRQYSTQRYEGRYHTDYTIPSDFFDYESSREHSNYDLSLSYLHDPDDPEYVDITLGRPS